MTFTRRQRIIGTVAVIVLAGAIVVGVAGTDRLVGLAPATTEITVASELPVIMSTSSTTTTTTSTTTTVAATTTAAATTTVAVTAAVAVTAPPPVATVPATPRPPVADPNTYSACSSWSLASINALRAGVGLGSLAPAGNTGACRWALALAKQGALSHSGLPCGGTGGQVVGFYGVSGGAVDPTSPAKIIQGWFASPSHYKVLTYAAFTRIDLQFVTMTRPDGSWRVYGVGNLCP